MSIGNATFLEIFWTCTGLIGFGVQCWALNDAIRNMYWLEARGMNGARHRIAIGNVRDELIRTVIQVIFILIGVVAMATAPVDAQNPVTALSYVISGGIIVTQILLVVKAIANRRDTAWLIAYLSAHLVENDVDPTQERNRHGR